MNGKYSRLVIHSRRVITVSDNAKYIVIIVAGRLSPTIVIIDA